MKVPFVDLKRQYSSIKDEINQAIQTVLENTSFVLGKSVAEFEEAFAKAHKVKHCIGVSSGTDGNHLALWALDIKQGDEVIIPVNTFIATAWGPVLCGAKPVFADCHPESYNIDPQRTEESINYRTKAIVAVHLYGQPSDLNPLRKTAETYGVHLVEDAAQAHLSEYKNIRVGGFGSVSSFSFYPGKNLGAYGEAGAVCTDSKNIAEKCRRMRNHGAPEKYEHVSYGHNYRMDGIQGAVLGVKLKYLGEWTDKRRKAASLYKEILKDTEGIVLPKEMPYAKHVYHLFVLKVEGGKARRDSLMKFLAENEISAGLHYPIPLHLQRCFMELGYRKGDFPVAEELADSALSLPMFPEITESEIQYTCGKIKEFLTRK